MSGSSRRVLAIAIDAAEPTLIRQMIAEGELPALKSLLSQGSWIKVEAPAHIGSGAVWPTFITGEEPNVHGIYGEWGWQAASMDLCRFPVRNLVPFWQTLAATGVTVGVLDLPFMPVLGFATGFEISEWAPHDVVEGRMRVAPEKLAGLIAKSAEHPLSSGRLGSAGPDNTEAMDSLSSGCLEGIKIRGKLAQALLQETCPHFALITFTEIHRSSHFLWRTVEPEDEVYSKGALGNLPPVKPTLKDLYTEMDRQVGELLKLVGEETTVFVFSLHGMRPAHGAPVFLGPLLCELGFARLADWGGLSWIGRANALMAAVKRHTPPALKKFYYRTLPATTTQRLARPTMLPAYDWSQTRAFSLPTDQHGWIRVNLCGRETGGIVPVEQYDEVCRQLEHTLRYLTTEEGKPLVRDVIRTAKRVEDALVQRLPDLIVHWEDSIFASPLRIKGSSVEVDAVVSKYTGQHALEGFCIFKGRIDEQPTAVLAAKDMGALITRCLDPTACH
jgi:predicted AlkP superfamily phosphohydrolase/phosphomutase